ncbi:MAG: riboflavin synthase [Chloroherpetonaceae bacterium]|nr:riboflavin synthase [Chloroherpetonaceae bacterium]MDW8438678.1 riboflavin synthase [Chloroherpetonaceae bacterium]
MFTGIVKDVGEVVALARRGDGLRLKIRFNSAEFDDLKIDESVCCNGVCQTVVAVDGKTFEVDAVAETLKKTTLGGWRVGATINLERALRPIDRMGGHYVQGHVDCVGKIVSIQSLSNSWEIWISFDPRFEPYIAPIGSIAVDGISLTVAEVNGASFKAAIIPYTWEHTTMRHKRVGDEVNLEFDILAKYVEKQLRGLRSRPLPLSVERLRELGY